MHFRSLIWLVAVFALVLPPAVASATAMGLGGHTMMSDCPHHYAAPPPVPCPEKGTARHAGFCCCPLMSHVVALLPAVVHGRNSQNFDAPVPGLARDLTGIFPHKELPPPRG